MSFIKVIFPVAGLNTGFWYKSNINGLFGKRVLCPFGRRNLTGFVIEESESEPGFDTKEIIRVFDDRPVFDNELLKFYKWVSDYYIVPLGMVLQLIIPQARGSQSLSFVRLKSGWEKGINEVPENLMDAVERLKEKPLSIRMVNKTPVFAKKIKLLEKLSVVERYDKFVSWVSRSAKKVDWLDSVKVENVELTLEQKGCVDIILQSFKNFEFKVFSLWGAPGSGKTEVYLRVAETVIEEGKKVLLLVPEISIASHLIDRCRKRLGSNRVLLYHSNLMKSERLGTIEESWDKAGLILGTRSLILAPISDVGIIILDEEQEPFYKQEDRVRYNARDIAVMRASMLKVPVVLGSATPSLETFYNTKKNNYILLKLSKTYGDAPQPSVELIDLRNEKVDVIKGVYLSKRLIDGIEETLRSGYKVILLQNRRGYAPFVYCKNCGWNAKCKNCSISLTYHKIEDALICHYCSCSMRVPEICPKCKSERISIQGAGTERLEEALKEVFSGNRVIRMDMDTTRKRGKHYELLKEFEKGKSCILIGTQMVAKGLDFPDVGLAGVILAEVALSFPDFRSSERTFNLIYQLCGRAGRGRIKSRVYIQTFNPDHYAIRLASEMKQDEFYKIELNFRKSFFYPPYSRACCITTVSSVNKDAERASRIIFDFFKRGNFEISLKGPSPAPIHLLKGKYRWQMLLLSGTHRVLKEALNTFYSNLDKEILSKGVKLVVDIDPMNF